MPIFFINESFINCSKQCAACRFLHVSHMMNPHQPFLWISSTVKLTSV